MIIVLSKNPIKDLELVFVLSNFEITVPSTLTSRFFIGLFTVKNFSFALSLSLRISPFFYIGQSFAIIFQLIDTSIFFKKSYSSSDFHLYLELV